MMVMDRVIYRRDRLLMHLLSEMEEQENEITSFAGNMLDDLSYVRLARDSIQRKWNRKFGRVTRSLEIYTK